MVERDGDAVGGAGSENEAVPVAGVVELVDVVVHEGEVFGDEDLGLGVGAVAGGVVFAVDAGVALAGGGDAVEVAEKAVVGGEGFLFGEPSFNFPFDFDLIVAANVGQRIYNGGGDVVAAAVFFVGDIELALDGRTVVAGFAAGDFAFEMLENAVGKVLGGRLVAIIEDVALGGGYNALDEQHENHQQCEDAEGGDGNEAASLHGEG